MRITKLKYIRSIVVSVTAAVMLAVTLTVFDSNMSTGSAASLKHIEEIIAEGGTFNILEIVPDKTAASFGYYINGQEPVASAYFDAYSDGTSQLCGWTAAMAKMTSPADRSAFANGLFGHLAAKGILGDTETTPLQYTYSNGADFYAEAYLPDDPENWNRLRLAVAETVDMPGTFTPSEGGAFRAEYAYTPAVDGLGGYVQNILRFEHTTAYEQGFYYYNPTFTRMDLIVLAPEFANAWDKWANVAIYALDAESGIYTYLATTEEIVKSGGFSSEVAYFHVKETETGAPGIDPLLFAYKAVADTSDNDDAPGDGYAPVVGEPAPPGPSYFARSITGYTYVGTGGNYALTPDESGLSNTVHFNEIYYKAGFKNNNLFKRYVLGLADPADNPNHLPDFNALNVTVTVKTADEVQPADISTADMIYISSGSDITGDAMTGYASVDIQDASAAAIHNFAAGGYPLIIDYAVVEGITEGSPVNRIQKLCLLCLQPDPAPTDLTSLSERTLDWLGLSYISGDADRTFVNNNIYCFSAFNTVSAVIPDPGSPGPKDIFTLVSPLFSEAFSQEVYTSGFSDVLGEIQDENFLKQIAGQTDLLPENVSVSAAVRHIINYSGRRQTNPKTSIRVLELQPAKVPSDKWLTAAAVRGWIGKTLPEDKITIVHMTTGEFIGKIEDINETYDMIYIGMSTESLHTSGGSTVYNDSSMNGLIYSNIGDIYKATIEMAGIREQDYVTVGGTKAISGGTGSTANRFRFSGNDITETKVTELRKYAQAGYPIILDDGFVSGYGIDTAKVDSSSYMYEAVSVIYGTYPNVMTQGYASVKENADTVIKYLNVSKPSIDLTVKPVEYADDSSASITVDPNDGHYYLNYVFSISNVTDPTPVSTTYNGKLFIDLNADGRYTANEGLNDISVRRTSDGGLVLPAEEAQTGGEYYRLSADIEYQVTRQMPQDYVGIIPWKLEVIKNGANQIHASAQGFTRIGAGIDKEIIKVLQIMQQGTSNTELNLSKQLSSSPKGIYGQLISNLADFTVTIDTIENSGYNSLESKGSGVFDFLNEYDMLIIGFNDTYDGIGAYTAPAIVRYISSGKSVLFTHDTTSLSQVPSASYPMAVSAYPYTKTLGNKDVVWNAVTQEYRSVDGAVSVFGSYKSYNPPIPGGYTLVGTYDGAVYTISGDKWYPGTALPFLQPTLYKYTVGSNKIPNSIMDWGYQFNTVIRDAVGLDRYGVTSAILGDIVNVNAPLSGGSIATILNNNRGVAYAPSSGRSLTVNEYQGYTNYALIRFGANSGNLYHYTNNTYSNRETTNVSQVNKGQITTYPYNVNSLNFGGNDGSITGYGGSYMKIGKTHEQYFQINMNTDDIVVWYCMSSGGTDNNSYYDDVPNDCVNAYYIYNKGNVTYSGVGHMSDASLYGPNATQEYVNEAKLFVNTMIAAYQSAVQAPSVAIKKDARGTSDSSEKYVLADNASVLSVDMSPTDESRAVYYRLSDPSVGVSNKMTVAYYIADASGSTVPGISEPVLPLTADGSDSMPLTTYNSNGVAVPMTETGGVMETRLKGGYVYKIYLPDASCLERLGNENVYSVRIYVKVTTMIGSATLMPAVDSIEIKKQQLFELM